MTVGDTPREVEAHRDEMVRRQVEALEAMRDSLKNLCEWLVESKGLGLLEETTKKAVSKSPKTTTGLGAETNAKKATPAEIATFNPEDLEWEEYTARSGKQTWRHPFDGQKIQQTKAYKALLECIKTVNLTGKRFYSDGKHYYWTRDGIIYRRPSR